MTKILKFNLVIISLIYVISVSNSALACGGMYGDDSGFFNSPATATASTSSNDGDS